MKKFDYQNRTIIGNVISVYNSLHSSFKHIFDDMDRNYNMIITANQWNADAKAQLESNDRPALAYNLLSGVIKHMVSIEETGRKKLKALPRTEADIDQAELHTKILDYCLGAQNFDTHRSRSFLDAIIARWGWLRTTWGFQDDELGMLDLTSVNPMNVMFDIGYSDTTLKKTRYVLYTPDMSLDEIVNQYAADNKELLDLILLEARSYFSHTPEQKKFISTAIQTLMATIGQFISGGYSDETNLNLRNENTWYDSKTGKFKILELHERRTERRFTIYDPVSGQLIDVTDDVLSDDSFTEDKVKVQELMKKYPEAPEPQWSLQKQIWITTVIPGLNLVVNEEPYTVQNGNFMFTPVFAYDFHADMSKSQSVIDELIDPQTDYNKRRSTMLEMLVRFSNIGYLVEDGAIEGFEEDYEGKKIGAYKRVNKGYLGKIKPEEMPKVPAELFRDAEESKMLIEYISGATKAIKGMSEGSNEPAKLFIAKKDVSTQLIQHLYQNVDNASVQVGENTIANVQMFMTMPRVLRITTDLDKPEYLHVNQPTISMQNGQLATEKLNDTTVGKYDVIVSTMPYSQSAREMEFLKLVDIMRFAIEINPQQAQKLLPVVIKASDTPYRAEFMEALGEMENQEEKQQIDTAMAALQQAFQQLELDKGKAELQEKRIKAQQESVKTQGLVLDNKKKELELSQVEDQELLRQEINRAIGL